MKIEMPDCYHCRARSDSLFHYCHIDEIDTINMNKSCSVYKKGQSIFQEGSRPLGIYCINEGSVKVSRYASNGKEQIIRIAKPGDFVGYASLLSEKRYPVSASALDECTICLVPREQITDLFRDNNNFSEGIVKLLCSTIETSYERMANLSYKPVKARIAEALLLLYKTFENVNNPDGLISVTREDLASLVGTVKETAIRVLRDFKDENLLETDKTKIRILDPQGLSRISRLYD